MNRENINLNIFEGLDSINSLGKDEFEEEIPQIKIKNNENEKSLEDKKEIKNNENEKSPVDKKETKKNENEKSPGDIKEIKKNENEKSPGDKKEIKNEQKDNKLKNIDKQKEKNITEIKKEENDDDSDDENEDEKVFVKKLRKVKKKIMYSIKDDIKFMIIPRDRIRSNIYYNFILFIILTSISIISDIFSMIISKTKGQIILGIISIFFRLLFIFSYLITFKYEFEALLILHLIINNCLFFSSVLFIMFLKIYHNENIPENFVLFCIIFYYISIGANFLNICCLYIKYYKIYTSMTEDDIKYLKIYNKKETSVSEIQLIEKKYN